MNLRPDGRQSVEFRRPIIKLNVVQSTPSIQYQVNNNYIIIQLLPYQKLKIEIEAAECSNLPFSL